MEKNKSESIVPSALQELHYRRDMDRFRVWRNGWFGDEFNATTSISPSPSKDIETAALTE